MRPTAVNLSSASGAQIKVYGEIDVELRVRKLRRTFPFTFVVADVVNPILGLDFLSSQKLVVDCANYTLYDPKTEIKITLNTSDTETISYSISNLNNVHPKAKEILKNFSSVTLPLQRNQIEELSTKSKVFHHIETKNTNPIAFRSRPLFGDKLEAAKAEFQSLLSDGIVQRSNSPWASPLHLVPKKESGQWRPCGDYRALNAHTVDDKYVIPHLRSLTMGLHGKKIFSKLDLLKAYMQIPVAESDIQKTAVCTPFGTFEFKFMPFGLKNAGATFQRFMDSIFSNVPNVYIYIDDILIASDSVEQHSQDLTKVLSILTENKLRISIDKCEFFKTSLKFLGYEIGIDGITAPADRIEAINNFAIPKTSTDLRRFMGTINFFRVMIPNFADIAFPVTEILRLNPKSKSLEWSDEAIDSFNKLKQSLAKSPTLKFPSPEQSTYHLVTDSSSYAIGAALYQLIDEQPHPIGFFSKKLSKTQRSYSTFDRELLGAYLSVLHFKNLIDGRNVTLFTDHKTIVSAFYSKSSPKSDKQQRQLSLISEYISSMEYIKGSSNIVADCMSRPVCATSIDAFDMQAIAESQKSDEEMKTYVERLKSYKLSNDLDIMCDISTPIPRPFIPLPLRENIIARLHNLAHPGFKNTSKIVKHRYFWPSMDKQIKTFVKNCSNCQQAKVTRHTKSPILPISSPSDRFQCVHIDIVGPLPPASVPDSTYFLPYKYLLTCIDRSTRWAEAIPLINTTAKSVAIAFLTGWISRFGVPLEVITDRGSQFESELFLHLSSIIGFQHIRTCAYHPQSNGIIERFHRTLKSAIMARKENWFTSLPIVMFSFHLTPNSSGFSPFTAVTGSDMLSPQPLIDKNYSANTSHEVLQQFVDEMKKINFQSLSSGDCHSSKPVYIPKDLNSCSKVWLRVDRVKKSLEAPYSGPYQVLERNPKFFILQLPHGRQSVSIDRLKPAYLPTNQSSVTPAPDSPVTSPSTSSDPVPSSSPSDPEPSSPRSISLPREEAKESEPTVQTRSGRKIRFKSNPDFRYF